MFHYCVSGLSVTSAFALPGLIGRTLPDDATPDVRIVLADVPAAIDDATTIGPNWQIARDRFLMIVPGIVRMLLVGGREIRVQPEAGVSAEQATAFVSGTGFGILLHQRRHMVLHASAVRVGDAAVLFCGPSGAGKSTIAAALGDRGYALVTDDFCSVAIRDDLPWIEPDGRQHKLWQQAIGALSMSERRAVAVRAEIEKYYVEPRAAVTAPLPVAAIYQLREARPPNAPGIVQPNIVDGALIIRRNAYRPTLVQRMGQRDLYFHGAAAMARKAGIYFLSRQLRFAEMPMVIGWLEDHWRGLGLLERAA